MRAFASPLVGERVGEWRSLARNIHDGSSRDAAAARDKREERDSSDVLALFFLVARFLPVSQVSLESGTAIIAEALMNNVGYINL